MTHARIAAALEYAESIPDLKFSVETKPEPGGEAGKRLFETIVSFVPPTDAFVTDRAGVHQGKLAVSYFVLSSKDELLTEAWDDLDMNLKEETFPARVGRRTPTSQEVDSARGRQDRPAESGVVRRFSMTDWGPRRFGSSFSLWNDSSCVQPYRGRTLQSPAPGSPRARLSKRRMQRASRPKNLHPEHTGWIQYDQSRALGEPGAGLWRVRPQ